VDIELLHQWRLALDEMDQYCNIFTLREPGRRINDVLTIFIYKQLHFTFFFL
jgi:hypothetical protein